MVRVFAELKAKASATLKTKNQVYEISETVKLREGYREEKVPLTEREREAETWANAILW